MTKDRDDEPVDVSAGLANAAKRLINGSKNTDRNRARESARNNLRSARWYHVASAIAAPSGSDFFTSGPATLQKRIGSQLVPTGKIETIYSDAAIEADTIVLVLQAGGIPFAIKDCPPLAPPNPCDLPPFTNFETTQEIGQIFPPVNTTLEYEMSLPPELINSNATLSFARRVTRAGDIVAAANAPATESSFSTILLDHQNTPPLFAVDLTGSTNPFIFGITAGQGAVFQNNITFQLGDEFGFRLRDVQTIDGGNVNLQGGEVTATLERFFNDDVLFSSEIVLARCFMRVIFQLNSNDSADVFPLAEDIIIRIE